MIKQLKTLVLAIGLVAGLSLASASFAAKPKEAAPAAAPAAAAPAPEAAAPVAPPAPAAAAATAQEFAAPAAFLCAPRGHSGGCAYTGECHCRCVQHAATCGTAISLASADECTSSTSSASSAAGGHSRCDQCFEL